jgi:hypothetical protein
VIAFTRALARERLLRDWLKQYSAGTTLTEIAAIAARRAARNAEAPGRAAQPEEIGDRRPPGVGGRQNYTGHAVSERRESRCG